MGNCGSAPRPKPRHKRSAAAQKAQHDKMPCKAAPKLEPEPIVLQPKPEDNPHLPLSPNEAEQAVQVQFHERIKKQMESPLPSPIATDKDSPDTPGPERKPDTPWPERKTREPSKSDKPSTNTDVAYAPGDMEEASSSTFFADLGHHIHVFVDGTRKHLKEYWMWYLIAMIIILITAFLLWHRKRLVAMCKARRGRKDLLEEDPPAPVPLEI